jgi:Zn-dependent peptidase ImmA (M78 family)
MSPRRRTTHRDPDVVALVEAGGGLYDARTLVVNQARQLNNLYRKFENGGSSPFERLIQLASLRGFTVSPMSSAGRSDPRRDAVVLMADSRTDKGGQIFYNPLRPKGRVAFSVAHEIVHSFFPSTKGGARFREMLDDDSQESSELERLCHAGAAELLMPVEDFRALVGGCWSLNRVEALAASFGASVEATAFRLATAYPRVAAAGMAYYRGTKGDEEKLRAINLDLQSRLFESDVRDEILSVAPPKYRRQSLHLSDIFPQKLFIPWNKSFDEDSCIYRTQGGRVVSAVEALPAHSVPKGTLEAMNAPYQRPEADPDHPDVLFLWKAA